MERKRALFKKKRIGVLMGGLSREREISLKSGAAVAGALSGCGYDVVTIDAGRDTAERLKDYGVEVAFIALHGRYGEDGMVQGLLELMGIPYTGSGVLSSALAMDKAATKVFLRHHSIPTPGFRVLKNGEGTVPEMDPPLIVKPAREGSTIGVSLVEDKALLQEAIEEARSHDDTVLVEDFIEGRELTVAILDRRVFPVVEIMPRERIYNFEAKYVKGRTEFKAPAALDDHTEALVKRVAMDAYTALGCRGGARVDVVLDNERRPYVLEVNTVPGMTGLSLFPMAAAAAGVGYEDLVEEMLLGAGLKGH